MDSNSKKPAPIIVFKIGSCNFSLGIKHSVLSISTPGSTVFPRDQARSSALARLLNEYLAALSYTYPDKFTLFAVTPLPYTQSAVREAKFALNTLNAVGLGLLSNHEGYYLGNSTLEPFFNAMNAINSSRVILFVHPNDACQYLGDGSLIESNPSKDKSFAFRSRKNSLLSTYNVLQLSIPRELLNIFLELRGLSSISLLPRRCSTTPN